VDLSDDSFAVSLRESNFLCSVYAAGLSTIATWCMLAVRPAILVAIQMKNFMAQPPVAELYDTRRLATPTLNHARYQTMR
jgi:hypothetical protein